MLTNVTTEIAPGECYRCGYDLRGIPDDQPCPECGLLAGRSRRTTDELHNSRPRWLWRIARGAQLILLAILLAGGWSVVCVNMYDLIQASPFSRRLAPFTSLIETLGWGLAALFELIGAWLLTSPEGYPPADRADRRLRQAIRFFAFVPLAIIVLSKLGFDAVRPGAYHGFAFWLEPHYFIFGFSTLAGAPLLFLICLQLRGLANRARSSHLAEHCLIVGIGASCSLIWIFIMSLWYRAERIRSPDWIARSDASLVIVLLLGVAAGLFLLWSLYLLIRFTIAFSLASRQLRRQWKRDDRSLPV